jgi:pimeloyl-ACP methyl ester carboxylesterase
VRPQTRYARSGDVSVAYQVSGNHPNDLLYCAGWLSHLELAWEQPDLARFFNRLASFSRLIRFDRRGMGLSDRDISPLTTLEQRAEDIGAVLNAAKSSRTAILAASEGCYMAAMFAATYPERVSALILYGGFARVSWAPDYPWGLTPEESEAGIAAITSQWGGPFDLTNGAPSVADDPACAEWYGAYLRAAASPSSAVAVQRLLSQIDLRSILPTIRVPTLVLHRTGDRWVDLDQGSHMARLIPDAKFVTLPGDDHMPWWGPQDALMGEVQEFITGSRASAHSERALLTVVFTDIVGSTERAASLGDLKWKDLLQAHDTAVRRQMRNFEGQVVNTTGDGFLLAFCGPTRAIQCTDAIRADLKSLGLDIRAGVHTGECERRGADLSGLTVHIAARIAAAAKADETLVSGTVKELVVGSNLRFAPAGTHSLKGVPGEWNLFQVAG